MHIVVFFFSLLKTLNHLFALQIVRTALEVNPYQGASGVSLRTWKQMTTSLSMW